MSNKITDFILKTPLNAGCLVVLFNLAPIFTLCSSSVIALVTLVKGVRDGGVLLLISLFINLIWFYIDDGYFLSLLLGVASFILAVVLRIFVSWQSVLVVNIPLSVGCVLTLFVWQDPNVEEVIVSILNNAGINEEVNVYSKMRITTACLLSLYTIAPIFLGRWLQAGLYPGKKFQLEFHNLSLSAILSVGLGVLITVCILVGYDLVAGVLMLPFLLVGLSSVHYVMAREKLSKFLLFIFYLLFVIAGHFIFLIVLIGGVESMFNLRKRFYRG